MKWDLVTSGFVGRLVGVSSKLWALAALLGTARTLSNEGKRGVGQDRGELKNLLVDVRGAFAELFVLWQLRRRNAPSRVRAPLREGLFVAAGGSKADGPDLEIDGRGFDIKAFGCQPTYRYFAINCRKHRKLRGRCEAYLCLLVPDWGRSVGIADLVPYQSVAEWPRRTLNVRGNPSFNLPIRDFHDAYSPTLPTPAALYGNRFDIPKTLDLAQTGAMGEMLARVCPKAAQALLNVDLAKPFDLMTPQHQGADADWDQLFG